MRGRHRDGLSGHHRDEALSVALVGDESPDGSPMEHFPGVYLHLGYTETQEKLLPSGLTSRGTSLSA